MRDYLIELLYDCSKAPYQKWFKSNTAWKQNIGDLLQLPMQSLGFHLACFLLKHDFSIQPKLEDHDVYHVLTDTGVSVHEEIGMQYFLFGNGKRSIYLYAVILIGSFFYPDHWKQFRLAYRKGKAALLFHHLDFSKMLTIPIQQIKTNFLIF